LIKREQTSRIQELIKLIHDNYARGRIIVIVRNVSLRKLIAALMTLMSI